MKKLVCFGFAVALCAVGLARPAQAEGKKATVKIVNKSDYDIHHMFLAPHGDDNWGPDQLGEHTITKKGGSFTLSSIPCETYDVQLVDEDGDKCEVESVDICGGSD